VIISNGKEPISQDHLARNANRFVIVLVIVQRKKQIQENGMNQGKLKRRPVVIATVRREKKSKPS